MSKSVWWQYCLPQHLLSRFLGWLADCRCPKLKNFAVRSFVKHFKVDLVEAEVENYKDFETFNDFFTRKLKADVRPIAAGDDCLVSPVDGTISEIGNLDKQKILQAKGKYFSLTSLLGGDAALAEQFVDGRFLTIYLSPRDYHRIHFPVDAELVAMRYVPGKLFSVNEVSVAKIDNLFARNERVVCEFDSPVGPFVMIAVGAMVVGSIATAWHGVVNSPRLGMINDWRYDEAEHAFKVGDEFGYFKLGSTVIMLFPEGKISWDENLSAGSALKMGQQIARIIQ